MSVPGDLTATGSNLPFENRVFVAGRVLLSSAGILDELVMSHTGISPLSRTQIGHRRVNLRFF